MSSRQLLLGASLHADCDTHALDQVLQTVIRSLPVRYGDTQAVRQACRELQTLAADRTDSRHVVTCKRAALLFSMWREQDIGPDDEYASLLRSRVLPMVMPRFLCDCAQSPDTLLVLATLLAECWAHELSD